MVQYSALEWAGFSRNQDMASLIRWPSLLIGSFADNGEIMRIAFLSLSAPPRKPRCPHSEAAASGSRSGKSGPGSKLLFNLLGRDICGCFTSRATITVYYRPLV